MQKTCTISRCQELVVVAEQSAVRSLQQHQDAAKEKVTEEEPDIAVVNAFNTSKCLLNKSTFG